MGLLFILSLNQLVKHYYHNMNFIALKNCLHEAERGIVFSVEDARKAEKYLVTNDQ